VTLARLARADLAVMVESAVVEHERDGRAWKAEWAAFPDLCLLSGAACRLALGLVEGMVVDPRAMARNLEAGGGYLASERVMRALAERTGKQSAHLLVYEAAMAGRQSGIGFREALAAAPAINALLTLEELDRLCDTTTPEPSAVLFVDRVIERLERARAEEARDWP
jgi:adenylosuccinate lyase